jgi:hypothetical protein
VFWAEAEQAESSLHYPQNVMLIYWRCEISRLFSGEDKMLICDIGHFESEQFVTQQLFEILSEKFTTFAIAKTTKKQILLIILYRYG